MGPTHSCQLPHALSCRGGPPPHAQLSQINSLESDLGRRHCVILPNLMAARFILNRSSGELEGDRGAFLPAFFLAPFFFFSAFFFFFSANSFILVSGSLSHLNSLSTWSYFSSQMMASWYRLRNYPSLLLKSSYRSL